MNPSKKMDCVRLKDAIQARLLEDRRGMSAEEVRAEIRRRLEDSDAPIARLWREIRSRAAKP